MHYSSILGVVALAASVVASPAITAAPRAPAVCKTYVTESTIVSTQHVCPDICVQPDSPSCPKFFCPLIPASCPPGETFTNPPAPAPTTPIATVTKACTVIVEEEVGCQQCGCLSCPRCVDAS